jgi:hypothetical protein
VSYNGGWRPHIESALCLDLARLIELGAIRDGARGALNWTNSYGEQTGSVGFAVALHRTPGLDADDSGTLTLDYSHTDRDGERQNVTCTIRLCTTPIHYGGLRWYFICPYTRRRALKLYKWNGIDWFCHRDAIRPKPTYAIQRVSGSERINAQRWALRRKLGDDVSDLFGEPFKPKWMRWRTFDRYLDRDNELAAREAPYFARMLGRLGLKEAAALADEWGG